MQNLKLLWDCSGFHHGLKAKTMKKKKILNNLGYLGMIFSASTPNISEALGSQRVPQLDQPSSLTALRAAGVQNLATNVLPLG
jgi:hypothetical protein